MVHATQINQDLMVFVIPKGNAETEEVRHQEDALLDLAYAAFVSKQVYRLVLTFWRSQRLNLFNNNVFHKVLDLYFSGNWMWRPNK